MHMEDNSNKVSRAIHKVMKLAVRMKLYNNSKEQVGESWEYPSCWNNQL